MASPIDRGANAIEQAGVVGSALRSPQQKASARKLVLVSLGGVLLINVYRADREQGSLYKRLWGTGVLGVMLSAVADFAPEIAGPFALLIFLGSLTNGGDQALQNLLGKAGTAVPSSSTPAAGAAYGTSPDTPNPHFPALTITPSPATGSPSTTVTH